jgi:REP element-mobilizing transposase RayT
MLNLSPPPYFSGLDPSLPLSVYYRNMPHWRQEGATYFVTFRLADALPQEKQQILRRQWEATHPPPRSEADWQDHAREITQQAERWLDQGFGDCVLSTPSAARIVAESLVRFQDQRYFTACYAVMPNHCHLVIRPFAGFPLERTLQACKGASARHINRQRNCIGPLWQEESYDQIIRDEEHLWRVVQYIGRNPGRAGLPRDRWVRWIHPDWQRAGWDFLDD